MRALGRWLRAELRESRKVQTGEHPVDAHVPDTLVNVEASRAHLIEARRVHAVILGAHPGDSIQPDIRRPLPLVGPDLIAIGSFHDARRAVAIAGWQVRVEHIRWFDRVVIDADKYEISNVHRWTPFRKAKRHDV
jgi:hypothetical protein